METAFRPEGAKNLVQEFQKYGYPVFLLKLVGIFKLSFSGMLIASMVYPDPRLTIVGAGGMIFLMLVAIVSHIKVKDGLSQTFAALMMLLFSSVALGLQLIKQKTSIQWAGPPPSTNTDLVQLLVGISCAIACLGMWCRSFLRGDYNLANYETLETRAREPLLVA